MKRSFHNLTIYTRPLVNGDLSLWVRHKFGSGKYSYSKTDIVVPAKSWDAKKKEVKSRDEFKVYRKKFVQLVDKRHELIDELNLGEITVEQALKKIQLYHITDTPTLRDFFENEFLNSKPKDYNTEKYYSIFNTLETSLEEAKLRDLTPLKVGYFKTHTDEIVNALKRTTKKNTATEYLKKLNTVLKAYDENEFRDKYFKKYYETEDVDIKRPVELETLNNAIKKITSLKRLEAYLYWLYSFCLRGLDGQDITLVSDELLVEDYPVEDYIYDFDIEGYDTPVHIELRRKKTSARTFTLMVNAYPTLSILYLLKEVIRINRPDEVNEEDGLKLFKWDRLSNKRKWDLYADFLQGRLTAILGKSFKSTRHTFTSTADKLGVALSDQQALIGNKSRKGSIANYSSIYEKRLDYIHLDVLGQYDIIRTYIELLIHIKETGLLENHIRTIDKQVYELDKTQHLDVSWREIIDKEIYQRRKRSFDSGKDVIRETL
jgi:hypothetical protein